MEYIPPINGNLADPDRSYIDANPGIGAEGSIPNAFALGHPIAEIVNAITASGQTPNPAVLNQLAQAIPLIAAGSGIQATETQRGFVELATGPEALGGLDTIRGLTSAGLASSKLYAQNGYQKLPGGAILQWGLTGSIAGSGSTATITFPVSFPNALGGLAGVNPSISNMQQPGNTASSFTLNDFVITNNSDLSGTFFWIAIGY